jgi:TRAP-type C4-dicarboxylate transport system permease small subunit
MPTGSFQQFMVGFSLMVVAILTGIFLSWIGGQLIDGFYGNNYMPASVIAYAQNTDFYQGTSGMGVTVYFVNLYYALCFFLPILSVLLFWQGFVKYQSSDSYASLAGGSDDGGGRGRMRRRRNR